MPAVDREGADARKVLNVSRVSDGMEGPGSHVEKQQYKHNNSDNQFEPRRDEAVRDKKQRDGAETPIDEPKILETRQDGT